MPPVGADHEIGVHVEEPGGRERLHAAHAGVRLYQVGHFGLHAQREVREAAGLPGQEVQKIPLRHEGKETAVHRQMGEVGQRDGRAEDISAQLAHLLMRQREESIEQAQLVDDLERRRMDGVAAKIAEEIGVLLEHEHIDAGTREQEAQHHSRRTAADDAAANGKGFGHRQPPSSISFCCLSMNSLVLSIPRWLSTKLRTAASTSTARLRPAATGIVTLRIGTPRISW